MNPKEEYYYNVLRHDITEWQEAVNAVFSRIQETLHRQFLSQEPGFVMSFLNLVEKELRKRAKEMVEQDEHHRD